MLAIRALLVQRNRERECEERDTTYDDVYVLTRDAEGKETEVHIPKVRPSGASSLNRHADGSWFGTGIPGLDGHEEQRFPLRAMNMCVMVDTRDSIYVCNVKRCGS